MSYNSGGFGNLSCSLCSFSAKFMSFNDRKLLLDVGKNSQDAYFELGGGSSF